MNESPIIVEQSFKLSAAMVWSAITEPDKMKQWFFESMTDFKTEVGFSTRFSVQAESRDFMHMWKIKEVIPLKKIVYDWRYECIEGAGTVHFLLLEQDNGTLLRVISEGIHTFPQDIPEFSRESCRGGWNYFIKERLAEYLS